MEFKVLVKKLILKYLPKSILIYITESLLKERAASNEFLNLSYSQEGEDLVLYRFFEHKKAGFYIDVGAHHPMRFSNTYKFYQLGWNGINIDPLPGSMNEFNRIRERDINLEIPISNDTSKNLTYYMFDEPALNTFDEPLALLRDKETSYNIIKKIAIKPFKLSEILDINLPSDVEIDFLSIDVEGLDMEVLCSNNWEKYRPNYVISESLVTNLVEDINSPMTLYLTDRGYSLVAKTANSLIYKRSS
jgi:hypothetical protein